MWAQVAIALSAFLACLFRILLTAKATIRCSEDDSSHSKVERIWILSSPEIRRNYSCKLLLRQNILVLLRWKFLFVCCLARVFYQFTKRVWFHWPPSIAASIHSLQERFQNVLAKSETCRRNSNVYCLHSSCWADCMRKKSAKAASFAEHILRW